MCGHLWEHQWGEASSWGGARHGVPGAPPPLLQVPACCTSSPEGLASSAHTATAPGPRAAAAGAGVGRRTPPCTQPSQPSSGPRAGPPGQQLACWGLRASSPASCGVPCPPPTLTPGQPAPTDPPGLWQVLHGLPGPAADQRIKGGSELGSAPSAGRAGGRPEGACPHAPLRGWHTAGEARSTSAPHPKTLTAPQPCGRFGARTRPHSTKEPRAPDRFVGAPRTQCGWPPLPPQSWDGQGLHLASPCPPGPLPCPPPRPAWPAAGSTGAQGPGHPVSPLSLRDAAG